MNDGKSVEVGIVGKEGAIGIHALYASATMPCGQLKQAAFASRAGIALSNLRISAGSPLPA